MELLDGFEVRDIDTAGARIRVAHGGEGPPLLLLHGYPQTHACWHRVAPMLARRFHVVCPDLRGYGDSSAPEEGEGSVNYTFRALAQDQVEVMAALGHGRFMVAGHDRGARTAHRLALDHPDRVAKVASVDVLPSHYVWSRASKASLTPLWHWLLMAQPAPFPEQMIGAMPARRFLEKLMPPAVIAPAAYDEYVRCFGEKTIRASCAEYRACATSDYAMDTADFEAGMKVTAPLLAVWGAASHSFAAPVDHLGVWRAYAEDVTGGPIESGHYIAEEKPAELADWFLRFFDS